MAQPEVLRRDLFEIINRIQQHEGVQLEVITLL